MAELLPEGAGALHRLSLLPARKMWLSPIFSMFNDASMYNNFDGSRWMYENLLKKEEDAGRCVACGQCEAVCPQQIEIIESLRLAHSAFAADA